MKLLVFGYLSVFLRIVSVCHGCEEPKPIVMKVIGETEAAGSILHSMEEPLGTWSFIVKEPHNLSAYFEDFLDIVPDAASSGSKLILTKPLDLEQIKKETKYTMTTFLLELHCGQFKFIRTIVVQPTSEFPPVINMPLHDFQIPEDSKPGTQIASLANYISDEDVPSDAWFFEEAPYLNRFTDVMTNANITFGLNTEGKLSLEKHVDFDNGPRRFVLNFTVQDNGGLMTWAVFYITVVNANDNPPTFVLKSDGDESNWQQVSEYSAIVDPKFTGPLTFLQPGPIAAVDDDGDVINFHIGLGYPKNYEDYIHLNPTTGMVSITNPVTDRLISHFLLVVAANDGGLLDQHTDQGHTATTSVLIVVAGRIFKGVGNNRSNSTRPDTQSNNADVDKGAGSDNGKSSGSDSNIANFNTNALFISVVIISTLFLILIIAVIIVACKIRKKRQMNDFLGNDKPMDRKTSDWSIHMRPVESDDGDKSFIRSLSGTGSPRPSLSHGNKTNNAMDDDVFMTGIAPYIDLRTAGDHPYPHTNIHESDTLTRGVIPYVQQTNFDSSTAAKSTPHRNSSSSTLPRHSTSKSTHGQQLQQQQQQPITQSKLGSNNNNINYTNILDSLNSLDILTSVKPITDDTNTTRPTKPVKPNYSLDDNTPGQSLKSRDVLVELEQIVMNESKYDVDENDDEKITRFTNEDPTTENYDFESPHNTSRMGNENEGVTDFRQDIDFGVVPHDQIANVDLDTNASNKSFIFPGGDTLGSPNNPFRNYNPILKSADEYYRHKMDSRNNVEL